METQSDFKELFELLNEQKVEYVVVGGYALAFHGVPRYTGDIDILVNPTRDNAERIVEALERFGFGGLGLGVDDFVKPESVIQLGVPPVRVDFMTTITGVSVEDAVTGGVDGMYGDVAIKYLGRAELVKNKQATGRMQDLADLEALDKK